MYHDDGMDSREIIRKLRSDGWVHKRTTGSHWHFGHPTKRGTVTVQHPRKDVPIRTILSIEAQSGLSLRRER